VVQYEHLYEQPASEGQAVGAPCQETVPAGQLRPIPPEPPAGWSDKLSPGAPLELSHEDGWWTVSFVARQVGGGGGGGGGSEKLLVKASHWGQSLHLVPLASLRPGWKWTASTNEWAVKTASGGGSKAAGGGASASGGGGGGAASGAKNPGRAMGGRAMGRGRGRGGARG
jgi:hypothetical protein